MKNLGLYAHINARIRVHLSQLLSSSQWETLYKSTDVASLMTRLDATPYAQWTKNVTTDEFIESLDDRITQAALTVEKKIAKQLHGSPREFIAALTEEYDIEHIKRALRSWQKKEPFASPAPDFTSGRYAIPWEVFNPKNPIEEIILALMHTPYGKALSAARELYRKTGTVFYLEIALEKDFFLRLSQLADSMSGTDKGCVRSLLGLQIDVYNVTNLIRCKLYFKLPPEHIEYLFYPNGRFVSPEKFFDAYVTRDTSEFVRKIAIGPAQSFASENVTVPLHDMALLLSEILKQALYREIKKILRGYPFTLGVPLSYILLYRWEMRQLRSLAWVLHLGRNEQLEQVRSNNPLLPTQG